MNKRIKKKHIKQENRRLIKEYPWLMPRNVWTGKVDPNYNYDWTLADDLHPGWHKLCIDMCAELKPLLEKAGFADEYFVVQVKEKFGQLRWYTNGYPEEIADECYGIVDKYTELSERTCAVCGRPGAMTVIHGYYMPYCRTCFNHIYDRRIQHGTMKKEDRPKYEEYAHIDY